MPPSAHPSSLREAWFSIPDGRGVAHREYLSTWHYGRWQTWTVRRLEELNRETAIPLCRIISTEDPAGSLFIIHTIMCFSFFLQFYHVITRYIICQQAFQGSLVYLDEIHVYEESWNSLGRNLFFMPFFPECKTIKWLLNFLQATSYVLLTFPSAFGTYKNPMAREVGKWWDTFLSLFFPPFRMVPNTF